MRCIAVITPINNEVGPDQNIPFDTRTAAMARLREFTAEGRQFRFELYEQVLVGSTVCQLETSPPREVPQCSEVSHEPS